MALHGPHFVAYLFDKVIVADANVESSSSRFVLEGTVPFMSDLHLVC
jgi:hypothetical protein